MRREFRCSYRVYVEDTDLMGIIYHGKYLYFFERARTELLRTLGVNLTTIAKSNTYFAIRDIHIRYIAPGRLDDVLTICTQIEKAKGCTLLLKQTMFNQDNTLLAEAIVQAITVDNLLKPKRALSEIMGDMQNG